MQPLFRFPLLGNYVVADREAYIFGTWWGAVLAASVVLVSVRFYNARQRTHLAPWRTIHDPMMRTWARIVGYEVGVSQREGRDPNPFTMLSYFALARNPDWDGAKALFHSMLQVSHVSTFADEELIRAELERRNDVSLDVEKVGELFRDAAGDLLKPEVTSHRRKTDNFLLACAIVASEIEQRFGSEERGRYLVEVVRGNAR